jgi:chromosome segregation ATPase
MRTREKLILLLVGATLVLGALIFFVFQGNETEANYTRWLIADKLNRGMSSPGGFVVDELPSGTLFYGGLSLFAIVMTIVVLKMVRDGEIQALRQRLRDLRTEKHEAESALQEQVWKGKTDRQAKDSVMRDLESNIEKIEALLSELNEKERELKTRDAELMALKSSAAEDAAGEFSPGADRKLREELRRRNEILQAKDAALKDVEQRFGAKTRLWENQLREKDSLLKDREGELESVRAEITDLNDRVDQLESARKRAEERLEQELRQKKEVLDTEALARQAEEKRLSEKIRGLEAQLSERDKALRQRDSDMSDLRRRFTEIEAAKAQAASAIEEISKKAEKDQQERERTLRDVEQRVGVRVHELQEEIGKRDLLLQTRGDEIKSLNTEVKALSARLSETAAAKIRAEEALQKDIINERAQHEADKVEYRQFEERYHSETRLLKAQLAEREEFLKRRDEEVRAFEQRAHQAQRRLEESNAAREASEKSLREELEKQQRQKQASEAAVRSLEQRYGTEVEALRKQLQEHEEARKGHDEENNALKTQVASLAQQLAKVGTAKEQAAHLLQQSLKKEKAALQASDSAAREIEDGFKAKIADLEAQLTEKQNLVGSRDTELGSLKAELQSVNQRMSDLATAKERAENLFEDAVRQQKELAQHKDTGIKQLEEDLNGKIWELETRLREKEELVQRRESEVSGFKNQLAELATAKENATRTLHEDLREKSELLRAKEAALGALEERFTGAVRDLENEIQKKQELLGARETEVKSLLTKLNSQSEQLVDIESSKDNASRALENDLRRATELAQSREAAMKALEERVTTRLHSIEGQLSEKQDLLAARDSEVDALMAKVGELTQKLGEIGAERERSDRLLQEELREKTALLESNESSVAELEQRFNGRIESLQRQVAEKQKLLEGSGAELGDLRAELNALSERLGEVETEKVKLEGLLEQERNKPDKALMVMPGLDGDRDGATNGERRGMDTLMSEREELLKARDKLIQNLMGELKDKKTQLARQEIEVWKGIERREAWKHRLAKVGIRLKD